MRFPLGKVPPKALMEVVFKHLGAERRDVILGASHGEDAAIIRAGRQLLAFSCDPISGALERIGQLSVRVATNDIATRGVEPSWFLSCIMLPEGSGRRVLNVICRQMDEAAEKLGVAIVGGHTEVTPGLDHPLIIGFAAGIVGKLGYVRCSDAKPGAKIILTKGAGVEGTAILASDRANLLRRRFGERFIEDARRFFEKTSVVKDAMIAFNSGFVQAMHDPTEGGIAGGLNELANASGTGFRVYEDLIKVAPETAEICRVFRIDPLRLVSSGSLLVVVDKSGSDRVLPKLREAGVDAAVIGEVLPDRAKRVIVTKSGREKALPLPHADDLWVALTRKRLTPR